MRLGELMVQQGLISQDQLRIALMEQEQDHNNIPLGRQLVRLGFVTEAMVRDLVAHTIGQESVDLDSVIADVEALKLVPEEFARRHHLLPIAFDETLKSLVVAMLMDAVKRGASDIHFEPEHAFLRIRYRIDGVLQQIRSLHKTYWPGIAVRLKVISGMDIAETRAPQDGRLNINLGGRPIDFRVASHPTIHGENIVLRVLDREKSIISMDRMGLRNETLDELRVMMSRPEGILIVTG